jgi:hypothetical protein
MKDFPVSAVFCYQPKRWFLVETQRVKREERRKVKRIILRKDEKAQRKGLYKFIVFVLPID